MDSVFITTRKQRVIRELRDYMLIALGMLMYAIGWTVYENNKNHIVVAGAGGCCGIGDFLFSEIAEI